MHASSSNQRISEGMHREKLFADNQFIPDISRIPTSGMFPTIILEPTDNRLNPRLQLQSPCSAASRFRHWAPFPTYKGLVLDANELGNYYSVMLNYVASIKADPYFIAALSVSIVGFVLNLSDPVKGMMPKFPPAKQCANGSSQEAFL